MLKAAWLRYRNGTAFASLKKIAFGFFLISPQADSVSPKARLNQRRSLIDAKKPGQFRKMP